MALKIDPAHPWRSQAFSGIPVVKLSFSEVHRGKPACEFAPEPVDVVTNATTATWYSEFDNTRMSERTIRDGMMNGVVEVTTEVGSTLTRSADNAVSHLRPLLYEYGAAKGTQIHMTYTGKHFSARPNVNQTVVSAMYTAPSADRWATASGIKLPRVVAGTAGAPSVAGMPQGAASVTASSTSFEGLRRTVAECAKSDDYGDRLFNMARIVCHATVLNVLNRKPEITPSTSHIGNVYSILSADTPSLTPAQLMGNVYVYTHTDMSEEYRAFLLMGVRGLQGYVGTVATIYSECYGEAEAKLDVANKRVDDVIFVRVGGHLPTANSAPTEGAYLRVLQNPDLAMSLYYAYARSMGLGHVATAVLTQCAIAPHLWLDRAISPYKNCQPKLDAAVYAILPSEDKADNALVSPLHIVGEASIIATSIKAGIGCILMAFKSGKDVDSGAVVTNVMNRLSDPESRRVMLRGVGSMYRNGAVGLEWFSPFSYDISAGTRECVRCWREAGYMIADYNKCPVTVLQQCLRGGVDMRNSMIGGHTAISENTYAQLIMNCLAAGVELPGMCERPTVATYAMLNNVALRLREWMPVITIVDISAAPQSGVIINDSPMNSSPQSKSTTASSVGKHGPTSRTTEPVSKLSHKKTLSGTHPRELILKTRQIGVEISSSSSGSGARDFPIQGVTYRPPYAQASSDAPTVVPSVRASTTASIPKENSQAVTKQPGGGSWADMMDDREENLEQTASGEESQDEIDRGITVNAVRPTKGLARSQGSSKSVTFSGRATSADSASRGSKINERTASSAPDESTAISISERGWSGKVSASDQSAVTDKSLTRSSKKSESVTDVAKKAPSSVVTTTRHADGMDI